MKTWIQRKIAFVLAASDHSPTIVNRFDYRTVADGGSFGIGFDPLKHHRFRPQRSILRFRCLSCAAAISVIEWSRPIAALRTHRRHLSVDLKARTGLDYRSSIVQVGQDIAEIEAGLQTLSGADQRLTGPNDRPQ